MTICVLFLYASGFVFVKLFPILMLQIGIHGCTAIFMSGSIAGAIFVLFTLEDRKGQSLDTLRSDSTENK